MASRTTMVDPRMPSFATKLFCNRVSLQVHDECVRHGCCKTESDQWRPPCGPFFQQPELSTLFIPDFDALDDEFPARLENIPNKVDMIKLRAQFPPTFRPENVDQLVCFTQSNSLTAAFNSTAGSSPECEAWIRFAGPSAGEYCMMLV